ncbi:hypothetical protein A3E20_03390 [Candidatus Saccharibacteria bacterium RIFCSPHIGHO2_12_FULL_47_16]|nr:MAG: hypothetical protein A3E20_03390 [Candidatus Saccharibacteria bacterium RIFCSPHIGHO2_12_FULL_47_16]
MLLDDHSTLTSELKQFHDGHIQLTSKEIASKKVLEATIGAVIHASEHKNKLVELSQNDIFGTVNEHFDKLPRGTLLFPSKFEREKLILTAWQHIVATVSPHSTS